MLALISDTGFGSCLIIATALVGVPLVWRAELAGLEAQVA